MDGYLSDAERLHYLSNLKVFASMGIEFYVRAALALLRILPHIGLQIIVPEIIEAVAVFVAGGIAAEGFVRPGIPALEAVSACGARGGNCALAVAVYRGNAVGRVLRRGVPVPRRAAIDQRPSRFGQAIEAVFRRAQHLSPTDLIARIRADDAQSVWRLRGLIAQIDGVFPAGLARAVAIHAAHAHMQLAVFQAAECAVRLIGFGQCLPGFRVVRADFKLPALGMAGPANVCAAITRNN